jgi:hypothetical protein
MVSKSTTLHAVVKILYNNFREPNFLSEMGSFFIIKFKSKNNLLSSFGVPASIKTHTEITYSLDYKYYLS